MGSTGGEIGRRMRSKAVAVRIVLGAKALCNKDDPTFFQLAMLTAVLAPQHRQEAHGGQRRHPGCRGCEDYEGEQTSFVRAAIRLINKLQRVQRSQEEIQEEQLAKLNNVKVKSVAEREREYR